MKLRDNLHAFIWSSPMTNNCNTYLIDGPTKILIDPGHRHLFEHVERGLKELGLGVADIDLEICTHAHPDHIEAVTLFKEAGVKTALLDQEWQMLVAMADLVRAMFGIDVKAVEPELKLQPGKLEVEGLDLGGLDLQIIHTPGHAPGSLTIHWPAEKVLVTGDLLFAGGVGRVDLPGGDGGALKKSIRGLAALDVDLMLPGHGDPLYGADQFKRNIEQVERFMFPMM